MDDRQKRDFNAALSAEVDAFLRGEPTRRDFVRQFGQMAGMIAIGGGSIPLFARQALAQAASQVAGAGLPRRRRAGDHAWALRHRRRLVLLPRDRPDRRQPLGHRRLYRRFHDWRRRRSSPARCATESPATISGATDRPIGCRRFSRFPLRNGAKNPILGHDSPKRLGRRGVRKDFR